MSTLQTIGIIVGVVTGLSGLGLGILKYLHERDTSRPRIVVRPRVLNLANRQAKQIEEDVGVIEIHNVGHVPVVGSHIGFLGTRGQHNECVIPEPRLLTGVKWTGQELRAQHDVMLGFNLEKMPDKLGRAVAVTAVGDIFKASRRDMRRFAKQRKAASA